MAWRGSSNSFRIGAPLGWGNLLYGDWLITRGRGIVASGGICLGYCVPPLSVIKYFQSHHLTFDWFLTIRRIYGSFFQVIRAKCQGLSTSC